LSAWLGVGVGLCPSDEKDKQELREMYLNWPWFREIVDLVAMILSKTDYSISENYENLLVTKTDNLVQLGREIRSRLVQTRMAVLEVTGSKDFGGPHVQLLRASSKIRHPYVDSINCVQAELLKELRNMGDEDSEIKNIRKDALIVSINGIACGMRNSG
jgi:phosphoenolpyruvate carboxylase